MNRVEILGTVLFVSGVLLFGLMHLAIANIVPDLGGFTGASGRFSRVMEAGMVNVPYFLSIGFMVTGLLMMLHRDIRKLNGSIPEDEQS
ncbi:hypothetical protein [Alkalibacillus salilacus]|uniref:Uncharacterized protein n=1 Tax=Alkalibacillus salilacus TaxID=284582 RepID=A0ABT9VEG5_9BACI|nr:hypothetical protein [Alkalibacillus salilacus]MDQ0159302.1 hypothetical protein [Alkalibacillus salilacus]